MSPKTAGTFMRIAAGLSLFFAIAMAISVQGDPIGGVDAFMKLIIPGTEGTSAIASTEGKLSLGLAGGLFAGFAAFMLFVTAPALEQGIDLVRRGSIVALIVWYVVDSGASIAAGAPLNALSNTVFLVLFLLPLLWIKKEELAAA